MTPDQIASRIGWEGGELELVECLAAPPDPAAQGFVATAELPPEQYVDIRAFDGVTLARYLHAPSCVAVWGTPMEVGGASHLLDGAVALDGRNGDAWARFEGEATELVLYNARGEVSLCRAQPSPVIRALRALSEPVVEFEATLPAVDELTRLARDTPSTPAWLAEATAARAGDELVHQLDALGLVARHAFGPAVDAIRKWAHGLDPSDTARLERMIARHVERAYDALEEAMEGDPFAMYMLVCERDRLESLLALRSLASMGSPVRDLVRGLDGHVLDQLASLPDPPPGAFEGDPSFGAADGFAPDAWWAEYAR